MTIDNEDFLKSLIQTFKTEAGEHIDKISNLLVTIEQDKSTIPTDKDVEDVFREMHSLKGGARSLGFTTLERICMEMESIFSIWKNKAFFYELELFNFFHSSLTIIRQMIDLDFQDKHLEMELSELADKINQFSNNNAEIEETNSKIDSEKNKTKKLKKETSKETAKKNKGSYKKQKTEFETSATNSKQAKQELKSTTQEKIVPVSKKIGETLRVKIDKLDKILLTAEEFIVHELQMEQGLEEFEKASAELKHMSNQLRKKFESTPNVSHHLKSISSVEETFYKLNNFFFWAVNSFKKDIFLLKDAVRSSMMVSCDDLFKIYPKMVRDISVEYGKEINFELQGASIEIDRRVLEKLKDPITHIIRNAIDHGIEKPEVRTKKGKQTTARISVNITLILGNKVEISITDDGAGIQTEAVKKKLIANKIYTEKKIETLSDHEIINSIFISGLSTSKIITELSGRGIGLAIVRSAIDDLGGNLEIKTQEHKGTSFVLTIPITTSTTRGVFVQCGSERYVIPSINVTRTDQIKTSKITTLESKPVYIKESKTISLVNLTGILGAQNNESKENNIVNIVVIHHLGKEIGLVVDQILYEQELVVKPLGNNLNYVKYIKGATVLGDGTLVPIINTSDIFASMEIAYSPMNVSNADDIKEEKVKSILIAEDSITTRMLLKDILESIGYRVTATEDGAEALAKLREQKTDCVISDVEMPRMDGFTLTQNIRADENLFDLPVILVTALKTKEDREKGFDAGANAYIEKEGFNPELLLETLNRLI